MESLPLQPENLSNLQENTDESLSIQTENLPALQENTESLLIDPSCLKEDSPELNMRIRNAILKVRTMRSNEPSAHTQHSSHSSHSVHGTAAW